jgi:anti-sigma regulatory factor (Ser/Thr protein kinase)
MTVVDRSTQCSFEHEAFIYDSDAAYTAVLAPMARDAAVAGDAALAVVSRHNADLLRDALGPVADAVTFLDAEAWYLHPTSTIAQYDGVLRDLGPATPAFVIGEVQFGRSPSEWVDWTRYEAALNRALEPHRARVVCPYDTRSLPPTVVDDARRTHPLVRTARGSEASADYLEPGVLIPRLGPTVGVPATVADVDLHVEGSVLAARRVFARAAAEAGFAPDRVDELTLAVNEVLTNALLHGGGTARLRVWAAAGTGLTCAVDDTGPGVDDALLGFVPPATDATGGYGIWMARRLFERSELLRSPTGGLTVVLATTH